MTITLNDITAFLLLMGGVMGIIIGAFVIYRQHRLVAGALVAFIGVFLLVFGLSFGSPPERQIVHSTAPTNAVQPAR